MRLSSKHQIAFALGTVMTFFSLKNIFNYFSSRIDRKILSIFILISIISIVVISVLSIIQLKAVFKQKSIVDYGKIAEELYYNINRLIVKGKTDINIITRNPVIVSSTSTAKQKLAELQNLQKTLKIYEDITIIDPKGLVITSTHYSYRGDWRYKRHFLECLKGKTVVSNVQAIRSPEKYIIDFTSPVFNSQGEVTSVIAAQFDMNNMSDIITHVQIEKTGHALLLNRNYKIIAHRSRERIFLKPTPKLIDQIQQQNDYLYFSDSHGQNYIGAYFDRSKLDNNPNTRSDHLTDHITDHMDWIVVVIQKEKEMFAPVNNFIWRIVLYSLIIGSVVVILAILFSKTITGPVKQLTEGAVVLGRGELEHRVKIDTIDELQQLAGAFNMMAQNLYESRQRLKQRETDLIKAQSLAHVGSWEWNVVDNSFYLSDEMRRICEIDDTERFTGFWDMLEKTIHPEDKPAVLSQIKSVLNLEAAGRLIYRIKRSDGKHRWIEAMPPNVNRFTDDGKPLSLLGTIQDITERKRSEEAIRESEEKHRRLVENLGREYFFYTHDLSGNIFYVSPSLTEMLGYDQKAFMKHYATYLTDNPNNAQIDSKKHAALNGLKQSPYQIEVFHKSGDPRMLELSEVPVFDADGKVIAIEGIAHDISERLKEAKEKRKALEFAAEQSKHAFIGQVAGKMAHDFNNVLMGIIGNAQLAIIRCVDPNAKQRLESIVEFSTRGKDITSNLMSFSKDQEPKQSSFKIEEKIDLVLKMFEKELDGINVIKTYAPNIPELLADPGMIQDALVNLIQNSIHAMSKVKHPTLQIRAYNQDDKVYFEIEDNGCGIPKEHQESVFTPSFTLKGSLDKTDSYASEIKGTGYGMSNVKKYIVEKHKGDISLESEPRKGCKIRIGLRVIQKELSYDEKREITKTNIFDGRKILLVEDEAAIADVQYHVLSNEPFNHDVEIAVNGQIAIDMFDRQSFDLVSLDYMLPGNINGLDVYHHIRKHNKQIPVMFISGNIEFLESMRNLKANDPNLEHLSKPVDNLDYVNEINKLIGRAFVSKSL